jgi:SAM-dependent methyltransferase
MKDRFSDHANQYAQFRPTYPPKLFDFIYSHLRHFDAVWDCGTGNGQAARELSQRFNKVFATDISAKQIENAHRAENIFYSIANEKSSFTDHSFDLITVAQAAHWFDMKMFADEAPRVLKPGGKIAIWGYGLFSVNDSIDSLINQFYVKVVGPYWDIERKHIDERYENLYFPFELIQSPPFVLSVSWTLPELKGYISTWSAVKKYFNEYKRDPVSDLISKIAPFWEEETMLIRFPIFLKLGLVS